MARNLTLRVLYVEDANENREYIEKILNREFSHIDIAVDGEEGLNKFKEKDYDVVVSDIKMPKLDGISMIEEIKKIKPSIYTIFITAHDDNEYLIRSIDIKVDKYLLKPLKIRELLSYLNEYSQVLEDKKLLKKQKEILEDYKKVIDSSLTISKCDKEGIINYVNQNFCDLSGYNKNELIGNTHLLVHHSLMDSLKFKDMWNDILNGKSHKIRIRDKNKRGGSFWLDSFIYPIMGKDGEVEEIISVGKDVTLEVIQAKELEETRDKQNRDDIEKAMDISMDNILNFIPVASFILEKGVIKNYNGFFQEIVSLNCSMDIYNLLLCENIKIKDIFGEEFELKIYTDMIDDYIFEQTQNRFLIRTKKIDNKNSLIVSFIDVK